MITSALEGGQLVIRGKDGVGVMVLAFKFSGVRA